MSLHLVLESKDLASLVFAVLDSYALLKLSMVSTRMRWLVDALAANTFANSSAFELRSCSHLRKMLVLRFDTRRQELFYEYTLQRPSEKLRFMSNVDVVVGRLVCMAVEFQVPLQYAVMRSLPGPPSVEIVVTAWKVVQIAFQDEHVGPRTDNLHGESLGRMLDLRLATVRMEALRFRVSGRQRVELPFAVTLLVCNVPVHHALSARERAVVRSCCMCMNCHQRPRVFESIDAPDKRYRVLCRTCFAHLFVQERSLRHTWRVSQHRLFEARRRFTVCNFVSGGERGERGELGAVQRFHAVVLKPQLAAALGARSWGDFLRQNYKYPLPYSRVLRAGPQRYEWAPGACPAQGD
jgi:hypothetical protein